MGIAGRGTWGGLLHYDHPFRFPEPAVFDRGLRMIGAIAGDIVGSRFEGLPLVPDDFELFHPQCAFTDDTICLLAVADALQGDRDFGGKLRTLARQHPMRGYGRSFIRWFTANEAPAYGSFGNGAPIRVASVGWLATSEAEVFEFADAQSVVTHNHPEAMAAARAVVNGAKCNAAEALLNDVRRTYAKETLVNSGKDACRSEPLGPRKDFSVIEVHVSTTLRKQACPEQPQGSMGERCHAINADPAPLEVWCAAVRLYW